jgi:hypothetical protein
LILAAAVAFAASAASAQTIAIGQQHQPPGGYFFAGYSGSGVSGPLAGRWVTEFYRMHSSSAHFIARRALDATAGQEQVQTINEQTCPALIPVLESLDGLVMPTFNIPNLSGQSGTVPFFPRPATMSTEATLYSIWGRAMQPDGHFADLQVSSGSGIVAGWGQFADQLLAPCWRAATSEGR